MGKGGILNLLRWDGRIWWEWVDLDDNGMDVMRMFLMKKGFWWEWEEKFWRGWNSGWRGHARGRQRGEAFVYCARCVFSIYNLLFVETFMIIIFCFFCILCLLCVPTLCLLLISNSFVFLCVAFLLFDMVPLLWKNISFLSYLMCTMWKLWLFRRAWNVL